MKILMMFSYAPLPPPLDLGGTKRNLPFLQENLTRHEVSVLSYGSREEEKTFQAKFGTICKQIRFVDRSRPWILNAIEHLWLLSTGRSPFRQVYRRVMQQALDELVASEAFDVIHCCTQLLGCFHFPENIAVISDTHEVTYDVLYRTFKTTRNLFHKFYSYLLYKLGKSEELRLCRRFDALITTTQRDHDVFIRELPQQKIFVVHNGVDPSFLVPQPVEAEPMTLAFTGKMSYYPNKHGIIFFLDEIFPLVRNQVPKAQIYVVGAYPSRELLARANKHVIVTGFVDDVRPFVARSEVFIIPLWIGGGIRGKALEAMAMRKPIVTTTVGCEGIDLQHGESAMFADSAADFAAAILRLLGDQPLRRRLAEHAYRNVIAEYNWERQGEKLDRVYHSVISAEPKQPMGFRYASQTMHVNR